MKDTAQLPLPSAIPCFLSSLLLFSDALGYPDWFATLYGSGVLVVCAFLICLGNTGKNAGEVKGFKLGGKQLFYSSRRPILLWTTGEHVVSIDHISSSPTTERNNKKKLVS